MSIIFQHLVRDTGGILPITTEAPTSPIGSQGLLIDSDGAVYAEIDGAINHYFCGLPFTASSQLVVSSDAVAFYDQGLGFTASGALATSPEEPTFFCQGVAFAAGGGLVISGGAPIFSSSNAYIASTTAPFLIAYDTSLLPWAASTNFLEVMPDSACLCVKANDTHIAYAQSTAPYLRLFTRADGLEVPLTGATLSAPTNDLHFIDESFNMLWYLDGSGDAKAFNYLTGVYYSPPSSAGTGTPQGIAISNEGDFSVTVGLTNVSMRSIRTNAVGSGTVNSAGTGCGRLNVRPNVPTFWVPFESTGLNRIYGYTIGNPSLFNYNSVASTITSNITHKFAGYNNAGDHGVLLGDDACDFYNIGAGQNASAYTRETTLPVSWPNGGVSAAAFSPDDSIILFSNGQIFDVSSIPFVELTPPALLPAAGRDCEFVATI